MALKRFGVSLEDDLLDALDQYVMENGFPNRSQAIRFLIEKTSSLCMIRTNGKLQAK